jgi:hypothetical protein
MLGAEGAVLFLERISPALEHLIIGGVARDGRDYDRRNADQGSITVEHIGDCHAALRKLQSELRTVKDPLQFREQRGAANKLHSTGLRRVDQAAGSTAPQKSRNYGIGIKNQPHAVARGDRHRSPLGSPPPSSPESDSNQASRVPH